MPAAVVARAVLPSTEGTAGPGHRVWPVGRFTPPPRGARIRGSSLQRRLWHRHHRLCCGCRPRVSPLASVGGCPAVLAPSGSWLEQGARCGEEIGWRPRRGRCTQKRDSHKAKLAAAVARAVLPGDGRGRSTRLVWVHASRGGDLGLEPGGGRPKITNEDPTDHDVQMPTAVVARAVLLGNGQGRSMRLVWIHASRGGGLGSEHTAAKNLTYCIAGCCCRESSPAWKRAGPVDAPCPGSRL